MWKTISFHYKKELKKGGNHIFSWKWCTLLVWILILQHVLNLSKFNNYVIFGPRISMLLTSLFLSSNFLFRVSMVTRSKQIVKPTTPDKKKQCSSYRRREKLLKQKCQQAIIKSGQPFSFCLYISLNSHVHQ